MVADENKHSFISIITVALVYLTIALLMLLPIVKNGNKVVAGRLGDPLLNVWIIAWDMHSIMTNNIRNIYNANIFYPEENTLTYSEPMFGLALLGLPFYLITKNYLFTYNILVLLSFVLGAFSCYILLKEIIDSRLSALAGAFVFSFNPWHIGHIPHIHVITTYWIPLCFWALIRYHKTISVKYLILFVVFFLLNALCSGHYLLIICVALFIFELVLFARFIFKREGLILFCRKNLLHAAIAIAIITVLLVVIYFPYFDMMGKKGIERTYSEIEKYSMQLSYYFHQSSESIIWEKINRLQELVINRKVIAPGNLQLVIICIAIILLFKRGIKLSSKDIILGFIAVGVVSLVLSFGVKIYLYGKYSIPGLFVVIKNIPGFNVMRAPSRFALFYYLAISILIAMMIDQLMKLNFFAKRGKSIFIGRVIIFCFIFGLLWIEFFVYPIHFTGVPNDGAIYPVYRWLYEQEWGAVAEFPMRRNLATLYMYNSTYHWRPLVNGYSGYYSPLQRRLKKAGLREQLDIVKGLGVKYIIIHKDLFPKLKLRVALLNVKHNGCRSVYDDKIAEAFLCK